ncbi:MAG: helix-turn-helix domain-containing protein [Synergistaceae bacterium]|jgi:transcriptional regulator with XRE-family HTH domain|nr:helix-turn-helix domain-containing protein [Synergistaceae bacterium]
MIKNIEIARKRIRELRKSQRLTQKQLAEKVSLSPNYLSQIESGARGISVPLLESIAEALGHKIGDFFRDSPEEDSLQLAIDNNLKDQLKQATDEQLDIAVAQLSDPEKLAIMNMLNGLDRDKVRKVYDFLHDQKQLAEFERMREG